MFRGDKMVDIQDIILASMEGKQFTAQIKAEAAGIIAGSNHALQELNELGLNVKLLLKDGDYIQAGTLVAEFSGNAKEVLLAEKIIIGKLAKTSGIATAANRAVYYAQGKLTVAAGAWKKMPLEFKEKVREAIIIGGATPRLLDKPFAYIDKNIVRIFGSITKALHACKTLENHVKIIQLKAENGTIMEETKEAVLAGAGIIMVDTGYIQDGVDCIKMLEELGVREKIKVAFAKGIKINDIPQLVDIGIDLVCIGKEIVDAPLLDMKLDVISI